MDLQFTPYDLMIYMDKKIAEGIYHTHENWKVRVDGTPDCKIWESFAGSEVSQNLPIMKIEHLFLDARDP